MSLLNDEQLESIEKQGKTRQIYKIEFFATVLVCIVLSTFVLSLYVPEGISSVPMVFEAIVFAVVLALLSSQWAGRLMPVIFITACTVFVIVKIVSFGGPEPNGPYDSVWLWIIGISLFVVILAVFRGVTYFDPQNKEAREYEKEMRRQGRW